MQIGDKSCTNSHQLVAKVDVVLIYDTKACTMEMKASTKLLYFLAVSDFYNGQ